MRRLKDPFRNDPFTNLYLASGGSKRVAGLLMLTHDDPEQVADRLFQFGMTEALARAKEQGESVEVLASEAEVQRLLYARPAQSGT